MVSGIMGNFMPVRRSFSNQTTHVLRASRVQTAAMTRVWDDESAESQRVWSAGPGTGL